MSKIDYAFSTVLRPNRYWTLSWGVVAPLVMAVIFIFYVVQFEPVKYGTVEYPQWAHIIGIILFQILSFKIETGKRFFVVESLKF